MRVKKLIKLLSKLDPDLEVMCLGKSSDYMFDGEDEVRVDTCDWFDVQGVEVQTYSGGDSAFIHCGESDTKL